MTSDVKEVAGRSFDYIVVGGGTAGFPLKATLSEKFSVLLIERGGSPYGNPLVLEKRFYGFSLIQTDEFSSVAHDFTSTDGVRNIIGRVLKPITCPLPMTGNASETTVKGIRFIESDGMTNQTFEVYLNQPKNCTSNGDVILSAGALGSPQILLLSGIGQLKYFKNFNIPHVLNLKGVGKRMKDNPCIVVLVDGGPQNQQLDPPQVSGIAKEFKFIVEGGVIPTSFSSTRMLMAAKVAFPVSEGELKLNSSDPRQNPSVKFNYLADEKDLEDCVDIKPANRALAKNYKPLVLARHLLCHSPGFHSSKQIMHWIFTFRISTLGMAFMHAFELKHIAGKRHLS